MNREQKVALLAGGSAFQSGLRVSILATLVLLLAVMPASAAPLNILYYGNSFLMEPFPLGLPGIISDIAVAAEHEAPNYYNASELGVDWNWHLENNTGVISSQLPSGGWDVVVMQNYSTQPTDTYLGDPALHLSSGVALYQAVAAVSPNVVPVLFETWARAPGHEYYTGDPPTFPGGADQMQQQVHDYYAQSETLINNAAGSDIARMAPVGDAWQSTGWANLHDTDLYHASNRGALLAALVAYSAIYNDPTVDDIDLHNVLANLGLSFADGDYLVQTAEHTLVPEPSSLMLLGCAVVSLGMWRIKCRRSR